MRKRKSLFDYLGVNIEELEWRRFFFFKTCSRDNGGLCVCVTNNVAERALCYLWQNCKWQQFLTALVWLYFSFQNPYELYTVDLRMPFSQPRIITLFWWVTRQDGNYSVTEKKPSVTSLCTEARKYFYCFFSVWFDDLVMEETSPASRHIVHFIWISSSECVVLVVNNSPQLRALLDVKYKNASKFIHY